MRLFPILLAALLTAPAFAADPFYLGAWKIVSAQIGPWWDEAQKPDLSESKELIGKTVTYKAAEIVGPRQFACKGPKYKVRPNDPPVMLFQGAFEEMQSKNKSVDPLAVAHKVGFQGTSWKTVENNCGYALELHFVDPTTADFALNNLIYTMKKQ
jgi:hypothetical protein